MSTEFSIDPASWEFRNNAIPIIQRLLREQLVLELANAKEHHTFAGDPVPRQGLMFKGYHSMPITYRGRG